MRFVIAALLVAALGIGQWLHGGLIFAALAWPSCLAVATAALFAGVAALREDFSWPARGGLLLVFALVLYGFWRWWQGGAEIGFLEVNNLVVGFLAAAAVVGGLRSPRTRLVLVFGILLLGLLQLLQLAAWRVGEGFYDSPWYSEQLRDWYETRRSWAHSGYYINKNHLAWLLNACCLLSAALCVWARLPAAVKFLCAWASAIFAGGTLLTLSRGGVLGLAGGLIVFLFLSLILTARARGKPKGAVLVLLCFLLAGVSFGSVYMIQTNHRVQMRLERVAEDEYRETMWFSGVRQAQIDPLLGTGPGTFSDYARILRPSRIPASEAVYAHNDWLQLLAEGGWLGLSLAVLGLLAITSSALVGTDGRLRSRSQLGLPQSTEGAITIGSLAVLTAFAVHSFFDFNLQLAANSLLAFCVLGLAASGAVGGRQGDSPKTPAWWNRGRLEGMLLILLAAGWVWLSAPHFLNETRLLLLVNDRMRGNLSEAVERAKAVSDETTHGGLHLAAGDIWFDQLALETAPISFRRARTISAWHYLQATQRLPLDRYPHLRMAMMQSLRDEHSAAYSQALEGVRLDPLSAFPYEYLAAVCEGAGDYPQAARLYELATRVSGGSAFARGRLRLLRQAEKTKEIPPLSPLPIRP